MHEEIIASSELYDSFPRYKMSDYNTRYSNGSIIPNGAIPPSKYSSTETESDFSSDDYEDSGGGDGGGGPYHPGDNGSNNLNGRINVSGFSTSASSSSSARRRRRERRRESRATSGFGSGSSGIVGLTSSLNLSRKSYSGRMSQRERSLSNASLGSGRGRRSSPVVPRMTTVTDLKHAIGRHRGISGSFTPAIDSVLFAMFYVTDMFDGILLSKDEISSLSSSLSSYYGKGGNRNNNKNNFPSTSSLYSSTSTSVASASASTSTSTLRTDVLSVLTKEIVYSLRISYFCPASKIVKLAELMEEQFPLERMDEPASFLDLLLSKVVSTEHHPPFLSYCDGSTGYVHRLPLEDQPHLKRSYFQPSVLTVQQLLQRKLQHHPSFRSRAKLGRRDGAAEAGLRFSSVPYPVLVLQVVRKPPVENKNAHNSKGNGSNDPRWIFRPNLPIIPNMEVDLTEFISETGGSPSTCSGTGSNNSNFNRYGYSKLYRKRGGDDHHFQLQQSFNSCMNESITSYYPASSNEDSLSYEAQVGGGEKWEHHVGGISESRPESRLAKGLKSAWKVMFKYLENFTSSSTDFTAQHFDDNIGRFKAENRNQGSGSGNEISDSFSGNFDELSSGSGNNSYNLHGQNHPRVGSSTLSLASNFEDNDQSYTNSPRFPSTPTSDRHRERERERPQVKMELIAVICHCEGDSYNGNHGSDESLRTKQVKGKSPQKYFVYCKAGDGFKGGGGGINDYDYVNGCNYAPWVLYQSRYGVAPQVTLIENFGKWISSLERNHEEFNMYEVPLEIRRVLQNPHLLIYKRVT